MKRHVAAFLRPLVAIVFVSIPPIVWDTGAWWSLLALLLLALGLGFLFGTFRVVPLAFADAVWRTAEEWRPSLAEAAGIALFVAVLAFTVAVGVALRRLSGRPALSVFRLCVAIFITANIAGLVVATRPWSLLLIGCGLIVLFAGVHYHDRKRSHLAITAPAVTLVLIGFALPAGDDLVPLAAALAWYWLGVTRLRRSERAARDAA